MSRLRVGDVAVEVPDGVPGPEAGADLLRAARLGVQFCREGDWRSGMRLLQKVAEEDRRDVRLPGSFYSWLGLLLARRQPKSREAVSLAEHGVRIEPYRIESYANLAQVYMLAGRLERASQTAERGLQLQPRNRRLRRLLLKIGTRRVPVLPFLDRSHVLNYWLGWLRHRLLGMRLPRSR